MSSAVDFERVAIVKESDVDDGGQGAPFAPDDDAPAPNGSPYSEYKAQESQRRLVCLSADDFFAPESVSDLVVPALGIAAGPPTGFIGQSYVGKTITAMSMGLAVVIGKALWGAWHVAQGPWLHLDYEQGKRHTKKRIHRLARAMGVTDEQLRQLIADGLIRIVVFPDLNLTTAGAADHFKREFEGARIVTADSLRLMLGGVDENSSQVRGLMGALSVASEATRAGVALIHHGGKTPIEGGRPRKETPRGSSGIIDEFQSMFVMTKAKGDPVALVTHEKDRELGEAVPDFGLRIEDVAGGAEGQDPKWGLRVVHVDREETRQKAETGDKAFLKAMEAALACIKDNPGIAGAEQVAQRVGGRPVPLRAAVKQHIADGTVVTRKAPRGGVRLYLKHMATAEEA
jgi:hypothetical protein